ncbi:hypothetical protein F2Q68_00044070 [Brassica cretica]|uniref:Uncharacterized protein n=1 Tax=Brassica cretica TaxID=69181 RepID=A0A8S9LTU9_BRACR|nr:hypothetical protein F2Q68_00044070 [Brassica cretica]
MHVGTQYPSPYMNYPNVLFSLLGLSEEHPQSVGLPIGALPTSISSAASSEGLGCGLSALIRAMFIFGNCARCVRGDGLSMGAGVC